MAIPAGYEVIPDGYELVGDDESPSFSQNPIPGTDPQWLAGKAPAQQQQYGPMDYAGAVGQSVANNTLGMLGGGLGLAFGTVEGAGRNLMGENVDTQALAQQRAHQMTPELPQALQTPLGQEYTEKGAHMLGELIPGGAVVHGMNRGGNILPRKAPTMEPIRPTPIPEGYEMVGPPREPVGPQMAEPFFPGDAAAQVDAFRTNERQNAAQAAIDARQKQMEIDVARQGNLDRNAAQRQRFEQAPIPPRPAEPAPPPAPFYPGDAAGHVGDFQAMQRQQGADAAIAARQRALEEQVARQAMLDRNAAERARMEQAPVPGLEEARAREIQDSINRTQELNQRGQQMNIVEDYGNNDPMSRMPEMRVDENGIPIRADLSMEARNLENPLQRNLWGDELPRKSEQEGVPLTEAMDSMGWAQRRGAINSEFRPPKGQRGAINVEDVKAAIDFFKKGFASANDVLASFKGAFSHFELEQMREALTDPKSRSTVVLMSPEEFHHLAAPRDREYMIGDFAEDRRQSVRDGLRDEKGLRDMPYLHIETKNGIAQVIGHEGRHRMDVFKEMGVDMVPVRIKDTALRWGETSRDQWPKEYRPEGLKSANHSNISLSDPLAVSYDQQGRRIPASQRGGLDMKGIFDALEKIRFPKQTDVASYLQDTVPGLMKQTKEAITRPDTADRIVADSMKAEDTPPVSANTESGMLLASSKWNNHPLLLGLGRWLQYSQKASNYVIDKVVKPLEINYAKMSEKEMGQLADVFREEATNEARFTPEQLAEKGLSKKQIDAYQMHRSALDKAFELQNRTAEAMGKKKITMLDAYMSSVWNGDWHAPIKTADGKLAWYVRTTTRGEAKKAIKFLRENFPELNVPEDMKPEFRKDMGNPNVPRDVMGAYQDMLSYFNGDPQTTAMIKAAMEQYATEKGYGAMGQNKHFLYKAGVRGFQGDRPWLSEAKDNKQLMSAQVGYLKNAIKWAHMQEAMAETKKVLSNEELNAKMPNAMEYAKQVVSSEYGIVNNLMKPLEDAVAELTGVSRSSLYRGTQNLKELTYLKLLGASVPYMIATPLQSLINTPSWHRILTNEGFSHNVAKTTTNAMVDFMGGVLNHYGEELSGKPVKAMPMTAIGKKALQYAEDNGIVAKTLFDEYGNIGENKALAEVRRAIGGTISLPEKLARLSTFMGFVHHLEQSGKYKGMEMEMFRRAEELTGMAITDFHSSERPLMVDKFGAAGQMTYAFKSFLFNQFNQMGVFAREMAKGSPAPMLAAVGMLSLLGGIQDLPGFQEADGLWNAFKTLVSKSAPEYYHLVSGPGLRGTVVGKLPELASYGLVSWALGTQMSSRFSPGVMDVERPLGNLTPVPEQLGDLASGAANVVGGAVGGDTTKIAQGVYDNAPNLLKGQMETRLDAFKGPKQGANQVYLNPNDLNSNRAQVVRTPEDEAKRRLGMTSLPEAKRKTLDYVARQETDRVKEAMKGVVDTAFSAIRQGNWEKARNNLKAYYKLNPDSSAMQSAISEKINSWTFTPEQRNAINARTTEEIMRLVRRLQMEK